MWTPWSEKFAIQVEVFDPSRLDGLPCVDGSLVNPEVNGIFFSDRDACKARLALQSLVSGGLAPNVSAHGAGDLRPERLVETLAKCVPMAGRDPLAGFVARGRK